MFPIQVKVNPYGPLWRRDVATGAVVPPLPAANLQVIAVLLASNLLEFTVQVEVLLVLRLAANLMVVRRPEILRDWSALDLSACVGPWS